MIRFAAASAALAVAILSAGAASAASSYRIAIGDLDLSTPRGAATFDRRIRGLAETACLSGGPLDQARCRTDFRREAFNQLPQAYRDDYARARSSRVVVRTSDAQR
ncbi:UrcA family protein [Brevundimonas sp. NIBR11]|uniref:UrcA family protein n=1 Tax=Brevundimonas sp. NIBR11 TaxID=3015999 RepID=UPI0022F08317|nr:UrcA family protein [Brevundimonas sp. NIBR11]WGM29807.1 hypothetical protein KKHFBJBL_00009 [Brevundimonas sp. NIBR11]